MPSRLLLVAIVIAKICRSPSLSVQFVKRISSSYKCEIVMSHTAVRYFLYLATSFRFLSFKVLDYETTARFLRSSCSRRSTHSICFLSASTSSPYRPLYFDNGNTNWPIKVSFGKSNCKTFLSMHRTKRFRLLLRYCLVNGRSEAGEIWYKMPRPSHRFKKERSAVCKKRCSGYATASILCYASLRRPGRITGQK